MNGQIFTRSHIIAFPVCGPESESEKSGRADLYRFMQGEFLPPYFYILHPLQHLMVVREEFSCINI